MKIQTMIEVSRELAKSGCVEERWESVEAEYSQSDKSGVIELTIWIAWGSPIVLRLDARKLAAAQELLEG